MQQANSTWVIAEKRHPESQVEDDDTELHTWVEHPVSRSMHGYIIGGSYIVTTVAGFLSEVASDVFLFVNFHIGKGGSTLKRLKHETGTRIDVVKGEDFVKIKGTDENIEQARQAIDALVKEVQTNELEPSHLFIVQH